MKQVSKSIFRLTVSLTLLLLLSACVTYHQPRYGADGVYFDQFHPQPRAVVFADPFFYPYWSLDYFYASRFGYATGWGGRYGHGWFHPGFGYPYGYYYHRGVQSPLVNDPYLDPRLRAIDERSRLTLTSDSGISVRPSVAPRLGSTSLRIQRQGSTDLMRPTRTQRAAGETVLRAPQQSARSGSVRRPPAVRQAPQVQPSVTRMPSRASRPSAGNRERSTRQVDPR
jgi:hypothetical protein